MPSYFYYILAAAAFVIFIIYTMATARTKLRRKLLTKIRAAYGSVPVKEYTQDELNKIRKYYDTISKNKKYSVDDITWNDLDLDTIFISMNQTFSSCGEDVLYDMLREPAQSVEELRERERVIDFFSENQLIREAFQLDYAVIGKTKKVSMIQYLGDFRKLQVKPDGYYWFHIVLILIAIGVTIFVPSIGVILFLSVIIYNLYTYYRDKSQLEAFYVSLAAMSRLVDSAKRIANHDCDALGAYLKILEDNVKPVSSLTKDMKWLGSSGTVGGSGDFMQILLDYFRMLTHYDFIKFNKMVKKVTNNETAILRLYRTMGFLEAMIAIASFRETLPFYCMGDYSETSGKVMELKDAYHPLIKEPVANSIHANRSVLITGSNASGKSTFLKMTALCAILGQTVCTVPAHEYKGRLYRIYSSMALQDNLQQQESYFIVEIKSLKRILDASLEEGAPVLCFIDEVLRGTNTVERIAASSQILKKLDETGVMCFAATHDIELTTMLERYYENYHFEEEVRDDTVYFSYELKTGKATSRNAIKLLSVIGYEDEVIKAAEAEAKHFVEEGSWASL